MSAVVGKDVCTPYYTSFHYLSPDIPNFTISLPIIRENYYFDGMLLLMVDIHAQSHHQGIGNTACPSSSRVNYKARMRSKLN